MSTSGNSEGTYASLFLCFMGCPMCGHMMRVYICTNEEGGEPYVQWRCSHCGNKGRGEHRED